MTNKNNNQPNPWELDLPIWLKSINKSNINGFNLDTVNSEITLNLNYFNKSDLINFEHGLRSWKSMKILEVTNKNKYKVVLSMDSTYLGFYFSTCNNKEESSINLKFSINKITYL